MSGAQKGKYRPWKTSVSFSNIPGKNLRRWQNKKSASDSCSNKTPYKKCIYTYTFNNYETLGKENRDSANEFLALTGFNADTDYCEEEFNKELGEEVDTEDCDSATSAVGGTEDLEENINYEDNIENHDSDTEDCDDESTEDSDEFEDAEKFNDSKDFDEGNENSSSGSKDGKSTDGNHCYEDDSGGSSPVDDNRELQSILLYDNSEISLDNAVLYVLEMWLKHNLTKSA